MLYQVLMDYTLNKDKNIYSIVTIEKKTIEITIQLSAVSENCFISIKEDGEYIVQNKICTAEEFILYETRNKSKSQLKGDFFFSYTVEHLKNRNFDRQYLGTQLLLFYTDME